MRGIPHLLMAGAVLALAACSNSTGPGEGNRDDPPSATERVDVEDNRFVAPAARVLVGGTVTWTWRGNNLHNVTFPGVPASATQTAGTYERTFATAGSFPYLCTIHGQAMSGTVTVVAAEPPGQ